MRPERIDIAPGYSISRILKGCWHLSGGHGAIDVERATLDTRDFVEAGITTIDLADIYGPAEDILGEARRRWPALAAQIEINSKAVPDFDALPTLTAAQIEAQVDKSRRRMGVDRIDMLTFAWWDPKRGDYLAAARVYRELQKKGKARFLGAINYRSDEIAAIVAAGVPLISHQIQYSLIDNRPEESGHVALCLKHGIGLLCYGVLAGGFIGERWLGAPEPGEPFANRSLRKYKLIIDDFGGWALFQDLLAILKRIADKHKTSIANVAMRATLDKPAVAGIIIGATSVKYLPDHLGLARVTLDSADKAAIQAVVSKRKGPKGDVYELERDKTGRHGSIMKYNLNEGRA